MSSKLLNTLNSVTQRLKNLENKITKPKQQRQPSRASRRRGPRNNRKSTNHSIQYAASLLYPHLFSSKIVDGTSMPTGTFQLTSEGTISADPTYHMGGLKLTVSSSPIVDYWAASSSAGGSWGGSDNLGTSISSLAAGARVVSACMLVEYMGSDSNSCQIHTWSDSGSTQFIPLDPTTIGNINAKPTSGVFNLRKSKVLLRWVPFDNTADQYAQTGSPKYNGTLGFVITSNTTELVHWKVFINLEYLPKSDVVSTGISPSPVDLVGYSRIRNALSNIPRILPFLIAIQNGAAIRQAQRLLNN